MAYGKMTNEQRSELLSAASGLNVIDIGAGDCSYAHEVARSANSVLCVDKAPMPKPTLLNIQTLCCYVVDLIKKPIQPRPQLAMVFWPQNIVIKGLLELLGSIDTVVYLGKNTNGTACAWPDFFLAMSTRPVLAYIPDARNVMIIYGRGEVDRPILGEELAGASTELMSFEESERRAELLNH